MRQFGLTDDISGNHIVESNAVVITHNNSRYGMSRARMRYTIVFIVVAAAEGGGGGGIIWAVVVNNSIFYTMILYIHFLWIPTRLRVFTPTVR